MSSLTELHELIEILSHPSPAVRVEALKMLLTLSPFLSAQAYMVQLRIIHTVKRYMTEQSDMSIHIFKTLVNLAENQSLYDHMIEEKVIAITMECLRDHAAPPSLREVELMLLVNLSRQEAGLKQIIQEGEEVEGLHIRRLIMWFLESKLKHNNNTDIYSYIGHILTNVSTLASGRKILLAHDRTQQFQMLCREIMSANAMRKHSMLTMVKNCFMEDMNHSYLLSRTLNVLPAVLSPIVGNEPFYRKDEYDGLLDDVLSMMNSSTQQREKDPQLRTIVYEILLLCARHKPSRIYLKSIQIYPILRGAHDEEKTIADNQELDDLLNELIPYFILDEDNDTIVDADKQKASQKEKASLEVVSDKSSSKPSPPSEQPVHYLGDELGDVVRAKHTNDASSTSSSSSSSSTNTIASSSAPQKASDDADDDAVNTVQPIDLEERSQVDPVTYKASPKPAPTAYAESVDVDDDDDKHYQRQQEDLDEEEEEDDLPPLAEDEEKYMHGLE